jgi:hypothetical protein
MSACLLALCHDSSDVASCGAAGVIKSGSYTDGSTRWIARVQINGQLMHLGTHRSEIAAALAYDRGARKHHGPQAILNFPG